MKKLFVLSIVVVFALLLTACGSGIHAITANNPGTLRDTIFSIEPRNNGTTSLWMTHDDVGVYCTRSSEIAATAMEILESGDDAIMQYRSINNNDAEYGWVWNTGSSCAGEKKGTTVYLIVSLRSANESQ